MAIYAGAAKIDITPDRPVWMDGMIRTHPSEGVHDRLYARALVLANSLKVQDAWAIVAVDVCGLNAADTITARQHAAKLCGLPADQIIVAATHTHSGPAALGIFNDPDKDYVSFLTRQIGLVIAEAFTALQPAATGYASGREDTISHYRRLLADDGHVVMNWEPFPAERIVKVLGEVDPELGVVKVTKAANPNEIIALVFNHAGHPNVLSGENYLLSADYPGLAMALLEKEFGGVAIFLNGAQGTMDIDGLRDRDWAGMDRIGTALARAVIATASNINPDAGTTLRGGSTRYTVPARQISDQEWHWAQEVIAQTKGPLQSLPDGVGDDYLAKLYLDLRAVQHLAIELEQVCLAIGDCAFLSFPGELYTEIGSRIKAASPFRHTFIVGLANGYIGYVPTRQAISEGGYAEDTRRVDAKAEEIVTEQSLALLRQVFRLKT